MPHIHPPGGAVDWPAREGTLGVVGVAPWATLAFLRALYAAWPATKDWHFPRVIADINTKLPSRGRHLELGETDPSPAIAQSIAELAAQGASVVVVPCNTAHLLYARWAAHAPVAVPHIVQATAQTLAARGVRRVAIFESRSLRAAGLYACTCTDIGLQVQPLDEPQAQDVAQAIEDIKQQDRLSDASADRMRSLIQSLARQGVQGVALGCTELATLAPLCAQAGMQVAESNACLAHAAAQLLRSGGPGTAA